MKLIKSKESVGVLKSATKEVTPKVKEKKYTGTVFKTGTNTKLSERRAIGKFETGFQSKLKTGANVKPSPGVGRTNIYNQNELRTQHIRPTWENVRKNETGTRTAIKDMKSSFDSKMKSGAIKPGSSYHKELDIRKNRVINTLTTRQKEIKENAMKIAPKTRVRSKYEYSQHFPAIKENYEKSLNMRSSLVKATSGTGYFKPQKGTGDIRSINTLEKKYRSWEKESRTKK